jgi:hypothetical protein
MNVSATRLVYVNKGSAKIKNEETGDFVNAVDNGIEIETGDTISIEGIAVESRGVGANIIEIPSRELNYPYLTNKMEMNMWYYIHHNYEYTCILPTTVQVYSGATDPTNPTYGYASGNNYNVERVFPTISEEGMFSLNQYQNSFFAGMRFYVGAWGQSKENITNPISYSSSGLADNTINPSTMDFHFIECNRQINCNLGYDSPANIASQLTANFHRGRFAPNVGLLWDRGDNNNQSGYFPQQFQTNRFINPNINQYGMIAGGVGDKDECVATISAIPYTFNSGQTGTIYEGKFFSYFSGLFGVLNPFYYYYGSRLLNGNNNNKINMDIAVPINKQGDIYLINTLSYIQLPTAPFPFVSSPQRGELFITNLNWTEQNLLWLRSLIHSQKNWKFGKRTNTEELNSQASKSQFYYNIPIGRYTDNIVSGKPYNDKIALPQPYNSSTAVKPDYVRTYAFYEKAFYEESGYILKGDPSYPAQEGYEVGDGGLLNDLSPKGWSQSLDINVFAVKVPYDLEGNYNWAIAIPLIARTYEQKFVVGNYAMVDFTMSRPEATIVQIITSEKYQLNPPTTNIAYNTIQKTISIGSPDMTCEFDDQRGRFAFKNMYWFNRIGNTRQAGKDADNPLNPDPEQEVITSNEVADNFFITLASKSVYYTKYALSGVGLVDISVLDEEENRYLIDRYNNEDIEAKFTGSLLERLGFTYEGLINMNGRAETIFQEQYYNTLEKTAYATFFPYPLTCNPEIDTTFNQYISVNPQSAPQFNLNTQLDLEKINVSASSAYIYATNLPRKLASPYWIIASDIIDGVKFVKDGIPVNCLAVCNRSYISGDFAFSFATDYTFKADIPFTISSIKTKVLTQDLLPADIDNGTSIIYKIQKAYQSLQVEEQQAQKTKSK